MRLTHRDKYGRWCSDGSKASLQLGYEDYPSILRGDAVDKLAEYEDTGLSPEEFKEKSESVLELYGKLKPYADAEEQGRLVILPCKIGDKVLDKIADHIFTIQMVELGYKAGTLFRCGNPGTSDYAAFYDFELGERFDILGHEEAEAALNGGKDE